GYMAILVFLIWISRHTIVKMWAQIVHPRPDAEMSDVSEGMSYRWALISVLLGLAGLAAFFAWLGLPWWAAILSVAMYFAISIAIHRIRAECGPRVHDAPSRGPDSMLTTALGSSAFDARQLVALNWFWWFNRGYRSHPMPIGLESLRFADRTRASQRAYFWA